MIQPDLNDAEIRRFWAKVGLPDASGCMLWLAKVNRTGYANVTIRRHDRRYTLRASRVSLALAVGSPPSANSEAAHAPREVCGNRHCVAPAHLRWATRTENEADKALDGTLLLGDQHGRAKLTWPLVREMRAKAAQRVSYATLAAAYGISRGQVGWVIRGRSWASESAVPGGVRPDPTLRGDRHPGAKLSREQVLEIRERYAAGGVTQAALAKEYGIGRATVGHVTSGRLWRDVA